MLKIIQALPFGRIEQLCIRNGEPCYDPAPRILEEIKFGPEPERQPDSGGAELKKEFRALFNHLERLGDAVVDIEIRHALPFRLTIDRGQELVS
jgi:hypothetical protein